MPAAEKCCFAGGDSDKQYDLAGSTGSELQVIGLASWMGSEWCVKTVWSDPSGKEQFEKESNMKPLLICGGSTCSI